MIITLLLMLIPMLIMMGGPFRTGCHAPNTKASGVGMGCRISIQGTALRSAPATTPHMKPQRLDLNRPLALVKINIVLTLRQLPL